MFFIAYTSKGQVRVFAGRVKIESHSSYNIEIFLSPAPFGIHTAENSEISRGFFQGLTVVFKHISDIFKPSFIKHFSRKPSIFKYLK